MPPTSTVPAVASFDALGVLPQLVRALAESGITEPFPIQAMTLPDSLSGRDVLGRGRTGSGKTVAFSLPVVSRLADSGTERSPRRPRALVLVPTRELATQVADTLVPLAQSVGQRVTLVYGGVGQVPQVNALRKGVDIVVATPGRLEDLIAQGHCRLDGVEVSVLDEADHLADLGFLPAVRRILDATPAGGQRLLFSATLDNDVDALVRRYLENPVTHAADPASSPVPDMAHHVLVVAGSDKQAVVTRLAAGEGRRLLFTRTKWGAKKLASQLDKSGIPAVELHGNLSQAARSKNLAAFSAGRARVLVATDIAARGIHVDDVGLVVHVDPPAEHKAYLHRSGRTARAGAVGVVVTIATPNQRRDVEKLARDAGVAPTFSKAAPDDAIVTDLTGPEAPRVAPGSAMVVPATERRERSDGAGSRNGRRNGPGGERRGANGRRGGGQRSERSPERRDERGGQRPRRSDDNRRGDGERSGGEGRPRRGAGPRTGSGGGGGNDVAARTGSGARKPGGSRSGPSRSRSGSTSGRGGAPSGRSGSSAGRSGGGSARSGAPSRRSGTPR